MRIRLHWNDGHETDVETGNEQPPIRLTMSTPRGGYRHFQRVAPLLSGEHPLIYEEAK